MIKLKGGTFLLIVAVLTCCSIANAELAGASLVSTEQPSNEANPEWYSKQEFPPLVDNPKVISHDACWLTNRIRSLGRLVSACKEGYQRSGALCYPVCAEGFRGVGPMCWQRNRTLKGYGRGFGKIPVCPSGYKYSRGLCYLPCGDGYLDRGRVCRETCPITKPYKCGMICTLDRESCREEQIVLSKGGLGFVSGLAAIAISIMAIFGTAGLATVMGAFGIAIGTTSMASSTLSLLDVLTSYPFCYIHDDDENSVQVLGEFKDKYQNMLRARCGNTTSD